MVLWEITVGTAYFLGLKRTYRLALRIQRRLVPSSRPKIRQFLHSRTRSVFDVALKVHRNIQQRDLEVGRSVGNWILRWLDRMKPSAQIRVNSPVKPPNLNTKITKQTNNSSYYGRSVQTSRNQDSGRHLFFASRKMWSKPFPSIAMIMQPPRPSGTITQYRHLFNGMASTNYGIGGSMGFQGVIRKDIMQYLLQY